MVYSYFSAKYISLSNCLVKEVLLVAAVFVAMEYNTCPQTPPFCAHVPLLDARDVVLRVKLTGPRAIVLSIPVLNRMQVFWCRLYNSYTMIYQQGQLNLYSNSWPRVYLMCRGNDLISRGNDIISRGTT